MFFRTAKQCGQRAFAPFRQVQFGSGTDGPTLTIGAAALEILDEEDEEEEDLAATHPGMPLNLGRSSMNMFGRLVGWHVVALLDQKG